MDLVLVLEKVIMGILHLDIEMTFGEGCHKIIDLIYEISN